MQTGFNFFQKRNVLFVPLVVIGLLTGIPLPSPIQELFFFLAGSLIVAGICLRLWAVGYLDRRYSGSVYFTADTLVTGGPYAYLRNPLYAANLMHALALVLINSNPLLLLFWVIIVWFYRQVVTQEEAFLLKRFGSSYDTYRKAVSPFLPRLRPYDSAVGVFQWKKLTHKEYQSVITPLILSLLFYYAKHIDLFHFFT